MKPPKWAMPYHEEYAKKIGELVEQYGVPSKEPVSLSPLWSALLASGMALGWEDMEYVCRNGTYPPGWNRNHRRNGRSGFTARLKGDLILIDLWDGGVKQTRMSMSMPIKRWPMHATYDIFNLSLAHYELAYNMWGFMTKREFNEEINPVMGARLADEIVRAIYKVLPESKPQRGKVAA